MIRQSHLIAVVGAFLIGCAVLAIGCAGVRSEAPEEEQGHTEATEREARSPQATTEEARCEGTRTIMMKGGFITTNDIPGCPNGGLLSGTDERDELQGKLGDDEIHGLGGVDAIFGGKGSDVIYGGPGDDSPLWGSDGDDVIYGGDGNDALGEQDLGEDVFYGGDGNDYIFAIRDKQQPDKLYCGEGRDDYFANKNDYVDSSCEIKNRVGPGMP